MHSLILSFICSTYMCRALVCSRPLIGLWGHRNQCATTPALHTLVEELDPQSKSVRCNKRPNQRQVFGSEPTEDIGAEFCQEVEQGLCRDGP